LSQFYTSYFEILAGTLLISVLLFSLLSQVRHLPTGSTLKTFFYIPAGKSVSDAIMLGGLALFITLVVSSLLVGTIFHEMFDNIQMQQINLAIRALPSATLIAIYGYLDDRFEVKPKVKLIFQILAIVGYSIATSALLTATNYSNLAFLLHVVVGMSLINGTNLLDGLDTLLMKISLVTFIGYAAFAAHAGNPLITSLAIVAIGSLLGFWYFNKEPSKIHLGEIGPAIIGLYILMLATLLFHYQMGKMPRLHILGMVLLPMSYPLCELTISFFRRIFNGKSPFRGDKFHVHQILKNDFGFSHTKATNILALVNFTVLLIHISLVILFDIHALIMFLSAFSIFIVFQSFIGKKKWIFSVKAENPIQFFFYAVTKKNVTILDVTQVNNLEIIIDKSWQSDSDHDEDVHKKNE